MKEEFITKNKGNITELQCLLYFEQLGYEVSIPYGENCRYDLIVDIGKFLLRVQCKTSKLSDDKKGIYFNTASTRVNTKEAKVIFYTKEEIDYFATFYNETCYLIPIIECLQQRRKTLRIIKEEKEKSCCNYAYNYEASLVIKDILSQNNIFPKKNKPQNNSVELKKYHSKLVVKLI